MSVKIEISQELLARAYWELDAGTPSIATLAELQAILAAWGGEPPQCDLVTGDVVCTRPRGHSGRCLMLERKVFAAPVVERQESVAVVLTEVEELLNDMLKDDDQTAHWFARRIGACLDRIKEINQ